MGKPAATVAPDILEAYERLVVTIPSVERKGASMPYTSRNGHMFSYLTSEGTLALRLPDADREAFVRKFRTGPVVQHGALMKEYVGVPPALLARTKDLRPFFARSYEYVGALKPKPTKRK